MNRLQRRFPDMTGTDSGFFRSSLILHNQRHPDMDIKDDEADSQPGIGETAIIRYQITELG